MPTYIRVKDLPNAATSPAADDFILLSGAANGARRISRADFLAAVAGFYTSDPSTYKLATLDAGNKVLVSQLPSSAFSFQGTWAASTNTPTLANGTGTGGDTYYASDSGSVDFGAGSISFLAGDAVVYDGSVWQKVPDVVNLLDGKGTLDEAKTTLEIPDVGSSPDEVSLNGMLGSMAFQSSEGISVARAEVESTTGTGSTQALTVTDGSSTNFVVQEDGSVSVGATNGAIAAADDDAGLVLQQSVGGVAELSRATDTDGHVVGKINFANRNNSNTVNPGSANYPAIATIESQLETSDSNAHDDSGGHLVFKTKPEAGLLAERVRIDSSGRLGIGTASPDRALHLYSSSVGTVLKLDTGGIDTGIEFAHSDAVAAGINCSTGGDLEFRTGSNSGASERWRIDGSNGNLIASSGVGIDFGSVAGGTGTPAANGGLLDDYERGTATPTDASGAGLTLAVVGCNYIKIGSQVTAWVQLTYPTTSDTSTARVGGFPFAFKASDIDRIGGFVVYQNTGLDVSVLGTNSSSEVTFRNNSGTAYTNAQLSEKIIWFCVTYDVS